MPLQFDNSWYHKLATLGQPVTPTPLQQGRLLYINQPLADQLGIDPALYQNNDSKIWWGAALLEGMQPFAQVYSGHQFGIWAGQLGDGRGILLGEQIAPNGERIDWHLKGAGLTPYSRMGDGRAVIRSSVREMLAGEAMYGLGIPTTRALSLAISDEPVYREKTEQAAMLIRTASSHLRFGHIEHLFANGQSEQLRQLIDYAINRHWPALQGQKDQYLLWLSSVVRRTARLIAKWQSVGFVHGVMNTDNMSLPGLTLDYGPFAFIDDYDPEFNGNHSDTEGRYRFDHQPTIGLWNLRRLVYALTSLPGSADFNQALQQYQPTLMQHWAALMRKKLGFFTASNEDNDLLIGLFKLMAKQKADYTRTFRLLSATRQKHADCPLRDEFIDRQQFDNWFARYRQRLNKESISDEQRQASMRAVNPVVVLRNYLAQIAIEQAEKGNASQLAALHQILLDPFSQQLEDTAWFNRPPDWGKQLQISCSS